MTAELVSEDGGSYAVRFEIGHIPTEAQANEIGGAIHQAIASYFDGKGAKVTREVGQAPLTAPPPKFLLS